MAKHIRSVDFSGWTYNCPFPKMTFVQKLNRKDTALKHEAGVYSLQLKISRPQD